ncbi:hypothetical protein HBI56_143080 [Parastagonospora nodorum]|uniref:Uncharacterized protein n=1 Tax=Phaeosphaeria nodorum (strain SN15 / ATCC MYA-4574 / FGSC 10173) TaxID=321614 RepID=A0A7U2I5K9_PHANO|nr:hypothetical protein HBH56_033970 [Parastagonospora nodorum]QRD00198.1 hypothetical protein JI435_414750 [Parastagonospora nodorum SN15]KAH3933981.1 hypothetical protein HBH54_065460 [Parastagonospora nodorum]KAH3952582.1 hypothetical protein HBH53_044570 [Parastagonospora nodorum]KAH3979575.1 hypothetical protein HBH51_055610 [Parastagonospora nodorum]
MNEGRAEGTAYSAGSACGDWGRQRQGSGTQGCGRGHELSEMSTVRKSTLVDRRILTRTTAQYSIHAWPFSYVQDGQWGGVIGAGQALGIA